MCLILPLLCNNFSLYQFFLAFCCYKVSVCALPCFDSTGNTEQNKTVFDWHKELIATAKQVVFLYWNFLERIKNSTNMTLVWL